jgi:diguanylate cyclase (GGDEF)-like protein
VIDNQTFMLAIGVGNIAFAVMMAGYMRNADNSPALRCWMWARLLGGIGQTCWWATPYLGAPLVQVLTPFAWIGGVVLEVAAYCLFFGMPNWRRIVYPSAAGAGLALVAGLLAGVSRLQMQWLMSFIMALFACGAAVVLLGQRKAPLLQRLIGINDGLFALAIWAWLIVENGRIDATLTMTPVGGITYLFSYLMMIVNGFGFLLLCKQKDDAMMKRLATIDGLTDSLNRRAFFERADSARLLALRLRKPIALMMLDLDHFKRLNDGFGHACGDEALRVFAATARGVLRDHDVLGRLGGEEFALALPGTGLDGARQAAERLRIAVAEAPLLSCAGGYRMTVSIGLVMIDANEELTAALARADHALYAAKSGGRNRVEIGPAIRRRA